MRHRKKTVKLSRTSAHRKAMLANLISSLVLEERVITTLAKAKVASPIAERMVTLAKRGTLAAHRRALKVLRDKEAVKKLFAEIGSRFDQRAGGYTRVLKMSSPRRGDAAQRALLLFSEEGIASPAKTKAAAKGKKEGKKEEKKEEKKEGSPPPEKG